MPRVTIELSESDLDYLTTEMAEGRGKSPSELFAQALRDYRRARGLEELERLAQEGIDSGEPFEITPEYWERKKREFLERRRAAAP